MRRMRGGRLLMKACSCYLGEDYDDVIDLLLRHPRIAVDPDPILRRCVD